MIAACIREHQPGARRRSVDGADTVAARSGTATGWELALAIFGIIAIIVGIQGLVTPN